MANYIRNPKVYLLAVFTLMFGCLMYLMGFSDPSAILIDVVIGGFIFIFGVVTLGNIALTKPRPSLHYLVQEGFIQIIHERVEVDGGMLYGVKVNKEQCPWPIEVRQTDERTLEIFYPDLDRPPYKIKLTPFN